MKKIEIKEIEKNIDIEYLVDLKINNKIIINKKNNNRSNKI
ncbi:MAG: hypothetical protein N4A57_02535 [Anaeromicrobium sp.]|jgi:hypothetical protein|nr:hypothetical protein [Anaeromicrobium sp.]MCT4593137.1 hypothetical protein [Anaeromicrobium sp.]